MKKIGIIGMGYVGKAFYELIKDHYEVVSYDPKLNKEFPSEQLKECSIVAICVPTPSKENGDCDTSIVQEMTQRVPNEYLLIKSTVTPTTTERLARLTNKHIAFSPEYISESTYQNPYYSSMSDMPYVVVGGDKESRIRVINILEPIYGPMTQYYQCTSTEAELIKYMANAYSALKVTFVNEMYDIANVFGADWHTIREGWLLDRRVERMSTSVFAEKRGYSGKCLPKDTMALINAAKNHGVFTHLLQGMHTSNSAVAYDRLEEHVPLKAINYISSMSTN